MTKVVRLGTLEASWQIFKFNGRRSQRRLLNLINLPKVVVILVKYNFNTKAVVHNDGH